MDPFIGSSQTSIVLATLADVASDDYYFTKFVSDALKGVTSITANTWNFAFAAAENNLNANFPVSGANLSNPAVAYVWRPSTQTKVGNIVDAVNACSSTFSEPAVINTETSEFGTFAGSLVSSVQDGDVIVFEFWARTTQGTAATRNDTVYFDGGVETNNTGTTVSNHASYIETPQTLTFTRQPLRTLTESIAISDSAVAHIVPAAGVNANILTEKTTLTLDATSGVHDQAFTGIGFQPKAMIIWGVPVSANDTYNEGYGTSYGFSDGTNNFCTAIASVDNVSTLDNSSMIRNDACISLLSPAAGNAELVRGKVKTFDSDGVTITWNVKNTTQYIVHALFIGGSDITNVKAKQETTGTTSLGNKAYTGYGFQPDIVFFCGGRNATINTLTATAQFCLGAATKTGGSKQFSWSMTQTDASPANTGGVDRSVFENNSALSVPSIGGTREFNMALATLDSDGYTLNHLGVATSSTYPFFCLAIKGGFWDVGNFQQRTSTGTTTISHVLAADPELLMIVAANTATANSVISTQTANAGSIGASDNTTEGYSLFGSVGITSPSVSTMISSTAKVLRTATPTATATSSTLTSEADVTDMATPGQEVLNYTTAQATARWTGYVMLAKGTSAALTRVLASDTLQYSLLQQVKQSDTLKYNLIGRIIHSNTLKYSLLKQIKQPNTLKYSLLKQVKQPNTLKYNLIGRIIHSNTLKYNLIGRIKKQNTLKYNLIGRITHQNTLKYSLVGRITHANTLKYNLWKQVKANRTLRYNLLKAILHANTLKYNLLSKVIHAYTLKYSLLKQVLANRTLKYSLIGRIVHANVLKYSLLRQIKQSNTLKYSLLKQVKQSRTLKYSLLKQVLKSNTLLWSLFGVLSRILHANTLKYSLIGRVKHQNTLQYNLLKQVKLSQTLKYSLLKQILKSQTLKYSLLKQVKKANTLLWSLIGTLFRIQHANTLKYSLIGRVTHQNTLKYNLLKQVLANRTLKYSLLRQALASRTLKYALLRQVRHSNTLLWSLTAVLSRIVHAYTLKYSLIQRLSHSFTLKYGLLNKAVKSNVLKYSLLKQVLANRTLRYSLLKQVTHPFTLKYNIIQRRVHVNTLKYSLLRQVKQSRTLKYSILQRITHQNTLRYNVLSLFTRVYRPFTLLWKVVYAQRPGYGGVTVPYKKPRVFKKPQLKTILYPVYTPAELRRIERQRQLRVFKPLAIIPAFSQSMNQVVAPFVVTNPISNTVIVKFASVQSETSVRFEGSVPVKIEASSERAKRNKASNGYFIASTSVTPRLQKIQKKTEKLAKISALWALVQHILKR